MAKLRLLPTAVTTGSHGGEVFACSYAPDGAFALSGGMDGHLRLWEADRGGHVRALRVGDKAVSACAVSPDGKHWLSGSLDGLLGWWDAFTQQKKSVLLAHTRPIADIVFDADGRTVATASWDRSLTLWRAGGERDGRTLTGHDDLVAGCRFTPDGTRLLSWSHDGTLRLWDVAQARQAAALEGHGRRVTAAAVSPDGRWAASAGRDGQLKLWDLAAAREAAAVPHEGEARACFFLLDGETLVTVTGEGRLTLFAVPSLQDGVELHTRLSLQCAALSPAGHQIALGCDDGRVRFVAVEGAEQKPLVVTPTRTSRRTATVLDRLLGRSRVKHAYSCTCPACRQPFNLPESGPAAAGTCPNCHRALRFSPVHRLVPEKA
ncbi:MAG TPA: WD40 repeat domain-containing protein [Gemmataceae bacterium]|nr:WD40 repeat domain-containing protein [Gemmataceae bacterium]